MNLKNLLLSVAALAATPLFAATYYVTPEGAGTKDGSSWENAFGVEEFRTKAAENVNGDVYNFAGGVYKPSQTVVFKVETGATLNGNADGERTIFSGDKNGNNNPDSGDANRLIRFQANTVDGISTKSIVIQDIDFTCVYTNCNDNSATMGALMIDNSGDVKINNCNFYGNWAQGQFGGAGCFIYRSTVVLTKCVFRNNSANYRGAAVRVFGNSTEKGLVTFADCTFKNNTNYHNMGIIFGANFKQINLINCTVADNKINGTENAGAIFVNPKATYDNKLTIVNSTIAGNTPSQLSFNGKGAYTNIVNSVITGVAGTNVIDFAADEDFTNVTLGGYNYVGPMGVEAIALATRAEEAQEEETTAKINWQPTDNVSAENTYASIFGENKINSDNVIVPVKYFAGASGEEVKEATEQWGLPADVDVTKDQNGTERTEGMMPGAYAITQKDIDGTTESVINVIDDAANTPRLVKVANGVYTIEGATEGVTAYTVNGATVAATSGNTIDLSSFANGLYIIKSGNAIFKVMK